MTLEGKCAYSNEPLRDMLGYSAEELTDMDVARLFFGDTAEDREALANVEGLAKGEATTETFEARLRHKDGHPVEVLITPTPISLAGREGFILIARSLSGQKAMEAALDDTRRQFGTMSDAIGLGVFRSAWGRRGTLLEANPAMRRILRLPLSVELSSIDWLDRIVDSEQREALVDRLNADKAIQDFPLGLRREDGGRAEVALYAVLVSGEDEQPLYCDGIVEDVTKKRRGVEEREALIAQLQTSLYFLQEPITKAVTPAVSVDMSETITRAATLMTKNRAGAVFVNAPDGELMGIATDHDFRARVVAEGISPDAPVRSIMTAPVASISSGAPIYDALLRMQARNIDHLAVMDESGKLMGIVRLRDLIHHQQSSPVVITDSIGRARSIEDINEAHARLPELVKAVVDSGAGTRYVNRIISGVSDGVLQRLVAMATDKLGPAPARFAFLALGSEGREEQTLLTDQDNALLYEDPPAEQAKEVSEYFLSMGTLVCDWLAEVGYEYCEGGVMAKNPRWNLPRSVWRQQFSHWIHNADPQELLELNMLFDFRCVHGEQQLARELRTWVFDQMESYPLFFLHFAQNALLYKPPISLLGNLQTTSSDEGVKALSLKEALMPVVNSARLYALRHRIDSTNTLDRLAELRDRGVITRELYEEMAARLRDPDAHQASPAGDRHRRETHAQQPSLPG